jgi:hypothetical protein
MLRFRPDVWPDVAPIASPTTAIGMMIQFAQPRRGMNAGMTRIKAAMPMMIEMRFRIILIMALQNEVSRAEA